MSSASSDVTSIIDNEQMTMVQYTTIITCFLMNMLDGMDVLIISFSASSISADWDLSSTALGIAFSSALVGMTLGALFVAPLADKVGRKSMILACALMMGISIYATAFAQDVNQLMALRFISGVGIGGMLASVSTLASEYSPNKSKEFWVSFVLSGYTAGAVLSGLIAAEIIPNYGWRALFRFAGIATLFCVPIILFFLSESLEYLVLRRPKNALQKVNRIINKMNQPSFDTLPLITENKISTISVRNLFKNGFQAKTLWLWFAFFNAFAVLYFLLSWIPKLTTAAGMPERLGIYSGTVFNGGSFLGVIIVGWLAARFSTRKMTLLFFIGAAALMCSFGLFTGSAMVLVMFALIGFGVQGSFTVLYAIATRIYPTEFRNTGVGWAIGAGRFGAIFSPIIAGFLVSAGLTFNALFIVFSIPCIIAGLAVMRIKADEIN